MATKTSKAPQWPTREVLVGVCLLALAGDGEAGGYLVGSIVGGALSDDGEGGSRHSKNHPQAADFMGDANEVQVTEARLRATPGGCEVDVTFTNVSRKTADVGFEVDILDSGGDRVTSRSTAVQQTAPGDTKTVSSEGTTAGPSGVRCPSGGQARVTDVSVFHI